MKTLLIKYFSLLRQKLFSLGILLPFLLIIFSSWAGKEVFRYSIFSTHDGNHHVARSFDAVKTISEGHFPLRWAGSLNYRCGVAIYNFFYPLIYYLVILINFFAHDVVFSLKIIYFSTFLIGTLSFYYWLNQELDNKKAAFAGAFLYLFAPYRFLLVFVRGSPEFLAYTLFPIVLYFYSRALKSSEDKKRFIFFLFLATVFGGLLTIAHNFVVMFLMPVLLIYLLVKLSQLKPLKIKTTGLTLFSFISTFGLGSFFIGPALIEEKYVKIGKLKTIDFRQHFPTFWQLIRSKWGYFYSSPGVKNDGMSFELGYAHWLILGIVGLFLLFKVYQNRRKIKTGFFLDNNWILIWSILALATIFLILPWSLFIWERIGLLQQIQFSWRLLGIAVFFISALFAFFLNKIQRKRFFWAVFLPVLSLAFYGNRNHLLSHPVSTQEAYFYTDFERLHPHRHSTTTFGDDVLSIQSKVACSFQTPLVSYSDNQPLDYLVVTRGNTYGRTNFFLPKKYNNDKFIKLGLEYFPGIYSFEINGHLIDNYRSCEGRVCLPGDYFKSGANYLSWRIHQSPIENFFNLISLLFLFIWLGLLGWSFWNRKHPHDIKKSLAISFVLGLFLFLRFYLLPQRTIFNWDQERDAVAIAKMILNKRPVLIGPRVLGPTGFFLPPWFFYLLTPFYFMAGLSPVAIYWFIASYCLLFFTASYLAISKIFDKLTAFLFLFAWAWHPQTVAMDIISWNPLIIPLFVVVLIYLLFKNEKKKSALFIFLIGLVFGFGVSLHIQFSLLFPLFVPFLLGIKKKERLITKAWHFFLGLILPFLPILIFDLRHNFLNLKLFEKFIFSSRNKNVLDFLPVWNNVVESITGFGPNNFVGILFFVFILFTFFYLIKLFSSNKIKKKLWQSMILVWIAMPLFFSFYGRRPSEYYFNYLFPLIFLAVSSLLAHWLKNKNWQKIIVFVVLLLAISVRLRGRIAAIAEDNPSSLFYKDRTVNFIAQTTKGKEKFNISFSVPIGSDGGFRYLLDYYKVMPTNNFHDPLFRFVIPSYKDKKRQLFIFGDIGVYIPGGWLRRNWL